MIRRIPLFPVRLLYIALFVIANGNVQAQWVRIRGPYGAIITSLLTVDSTVFAGTYYDGVYRSSDKGQTWSPAGNGLPKHPVAALISVDGLIFAGTEAWSLPIEPIEDGSVYWSSDFGSSWTEMKVGFQAGISVNCLKSVGTCLLAGTNVGIYWSTSAGSKWNFASLGVPNSNVRAIGACTNDVGGINLFASTQPGGNSNRAGLFLSVDTGKTWTSPNTNIGDGEIWGFASIGRNIFAAVSGVFRSTDSGKSWEAVNTGIPPNTFVKNLCVADTVLFATTYNDGVFCSSIHQLQWTPTNVGLSNPYVGPIASFDGGILVGTSSGVLKLMKGTTNWTEANTGLNNIYVSAIAGAGASLFVGTENGLFCSFDDGEHWNQKDATLANQHISAIALHGANLFATSMGGIDKLGGGVFRSIDNGRTWMRQGNGLLETAYYGVTEQGSKLFVGEVYTGVLKSTDGGDGWVAARRGLPGMYVGTFAVHDSSLFLAGQGEGIFRSTDDGQNWVAVDSGLNNGDIWAITVLQPDKDGSAIVAGTYGDGVFGSTDNGATWTNTNPGVKPDYVITLATYRSNLFAGTVEDGIYVSTDCGVSWTTINSGLTNLYVRSLAIHGTDLYAGTNGSGLWKRPLSQITSTQNVSIQRPVIFFLHQNYPNPFNPSTTIRFSVAERSRVRVTIFNLLGQQVAELANEEMSAGYFEKTWNANLASGLYFYRLEAVSISDPGKRFVDVKKMILLK